jgi:3-phosphoshikimate 1-carboxyvinyltransferase
MSTSAAAAARTDLARGNKSIRHESTDDALTPWSALCGVRALRIDPLGRPVTGELAVPGSKSLSNRALILAAMAEGRTQLSGLLRCDDTFWCTDALRRLGAEIEFEGASANVRGIGRKRFAQGTIHVGSAGTIARFLPPFLAAGEAGRWRVTASKQMSRRPIGPLFDALREGGAEISFQGAASCFPVVINGNTFTGGRLRMSGAVSSQFISGVLMGAAQSRDGVELDVEGGIVQSEYVRITIDTMRHFGVSIDADAGFEHFAVKPAGYHGCDIAVEADASTATYFAALAVATGGRLTLRNLAPATGQPDYGFMAILERLGCRVERGADRTTVSHDGGLRGGFTVDMRPFSDAALTLAAIAPFADAPITITGIEHIRHHECDRIDAICRSLSALGVPIEERLDGLTVTPARPRFGVLDTFEDHRVAMSLAVLGAVGEGVELLNPACVSKTCPTFFDLIGELGVQMVTVA